MGREAEPYPCFVRYVITSPARDTLFIKTFSLDVWIDVQRQWVYLEGIFSGSADIKHLLPVESARFNNINSEFLAVMKKVCEYFASMRCPCKNYCSLYQVRVNVYPPEKDI